MVLTCVVCYSVSANAVDVNPADYFTFTSTNSVNDEITFYVNLNANKKLFGAVIWLEYDPAVLQPQDAKAGLSSAAASFGVEAHGAVSGSSNLYALSFTGSKAVSVTKSTQVFYATFKVIGNTRPKTTVKAYCNQLLLTESNLYGGGDTKTLIGSKSVVTLSDVTLVSAKNGDRGIDVTWNTVKGAESYRIYRRVTGTANWSGSTIFDVAAGTGTKQTYTDKSVTQGTSYDYTVRAVNASGLSAGYNSAGVSTMYVAAPTTITLTSVTGGFKVAWNAVSKATLYRVFRRELDANGDPATGWTKLGDTASASVRTYSDTSGLVSGKTYEYTVFTYYDNDTGDNKTGVFSGYSATAVQTYIANPTVTLTNAVSGVTVTWTKSAGATKFVIYRRYKTTDSWKALATVSATAAASYTDTGATNGKTHYYTVRAFSATASSSYTAKSIFYVAAPSSVKLTQVAKGFKVTWTAVSGATQYRVYRRELDAKGNALTGWKTLTTTKNLSYSDASGLTAGKRYHYAVRANNTTGKAWSGLKTANAYFLATPSVTLANGTSGVTVSWNKITGATKYYVYRRLKPTDSWKLLKTVTTLTYTDTTAANGTEYYYTVCAATASTKSAYTAKSITFVAAPTAVKLAQIDKGFKVAWGAVKGASQYKVYRRQVDANGKVLVSWSLLTTTTARTYSDASGLKQGSYYEYCVRAYNGTAKTLSGLSNIPRSAFLATPVFELTDTANGVSIDWDAVEGATAYTVYKKANASDAWSTLEVLTADADLSVLDADVVPGSTYYYTVRANCGTVRSAFTAQRITVGA